MGIFVRGNMLWLRYRDEAGKIRRDASGFAVGEEAKAIETLAEARA